MPFVSISFFLPTSFVLKVGRGWFLVSGGSGVFSFCLFLAWYPIQPVAPSPPSAPSSADLSRTIGSCSISFSLPASFVSSVRSSNSHPDLLVIQHPTHFFRSHRSSTLDFRFLSHYRYIKAIMLYKGNYWTHLLATCIPYWYNRTSLQDSAR